MKQQLASISIVVKSYDEAIIFYTKQLGFDLIEDTLLSETKRWVLLAPPGSDGCKLLLAQAANEEQQSRIGNQTGGRVFLFLHTDDFRRDYNNYAAKGIEFLAVRAVSDASDTALSPELVHLLSGGNVSMWMACRALLGKPALLPEFLRLARDTKLAARNLAAALVKVIGPA